MIYELNGINSQPVYTIGSVTLRVQLGTKEATVKFQVVHENFPIVEAGILGAPFFRENGININFRTSTLSTEHTENPESPEPPDLPKTLIIQPRSETLVPIKTDKEDDIALIFHAQTIGEERVLLLGNVINFVRDGQILVYVVNPSGDSIEFLPHQLANVQHDIFEAARVHHGSESAEQSNKENRMKKLAQVIQTNHLNYEE